VITTEVKLLEGVRFIINVKLEEPFEHKYGVRIERISGRLLAESKEFRIILKALGFRKVEEEPWTDNIIYVQYPVCYIRYKAIQALINAYYKTILFLYDNARLFKKIPEGEQFSWRYFTPYTWFKALWDKGKKEDNQDLLPHESLSLSRNMLDTLLFHPQNITYDDADNPSEPMSTGYVENLDLQEPTAGMPGLPIEHTDGGNTIPQPYWDYLNEHYWYFPQQGND